MPQDERSVAYQSRVQDGGLRDKGTNQDQQERFALQGARPAKLSYSSLQAVAAQGPGHLQPQQGNSISRKAGPGRRLVGELGGAQHNYPHPGTDEETSDNKQEHKVREVTQDCRGVSGHVQPGR